MEIPRSRQGTVEREKHHPPQQNVTVMEELVSGHVCDSWELQERWHVLTHSIRHKHAFYVQQMDV